MPVRPAIRKSFQFSRAHLEILKDVNLNKPFNHKSNAPIKTNCDMQESRCWCHRILGQPPALHQPLAAIWKLEYHVVVFASNLFWNFNIILKRGEVENLVKHATSCVFYAFLSGCGHSWMAIDSRIIACWFANYCGVSGLTSVPGPTPDPCPGRLSLVLSVWVTEPASAPLLPPRHWLGPAITCYRPSNIGNNEPIITLIMTGNNGIVIIGNNDVTSKLK